MTIVSAASQRGVMLWTSGTHFCYHTCRKNSTIITCTIDPEGSRCAREEHDAAKQDLISLRRWHVGLDVIRAFGPNRPVMTLSEVAAATELARPTARRMLLTLEELGYVRVAQGGFALTPRVLELGMAYIGSTSIWEIARPHMEQLVGRTGESSSLAQLDGSDIVYVARVAVPKIITLAVTIGTRFPALSTSLGKVLLAELPSDKLEQVLPAEPFRHHTTLAARSGRARTSAG